jgi:hypothetical protein
MRPILLSHVLFGLTTIAVQFHGTNGFSFLLMARRGQGNLKRSLESDTAPPNRAASLNQGKGQEVTGVTLPAEVRIIILLCSLKPAVRKCRLRSGMLIFTPLFLRSTISSVVCYLERAR